MQVTNFFASEGFKFGSTGDILDPQTLKKNPMKNKKENQKFDFSHHFCSQAILDF